MPNRATYTTSRAPRGTYAATGGRNTVGGYVPYGAQAQRSSAPRPSAGQARTGRTGGAGNGGKPSGGRGGSGGGWKIALVVILLAALIAAAVLLVPRFLGANGGGDPGSQAANRDELLAVRERGMGEQMDNTGGYNWSCLKTLENGRLAYIVGDETKSHFGIDVSEHQGDIDWDAVAADGVEFAFVRLGVRGASVGTVNLDENYDANVAGARNAGVPIGVYFFSQAINEEEATEEANFVVEHLRGVDLAYPVALDAETLHEMDSRANDLSREQVTANALAFCRTIEEAGYPVVIYGNYDDLARMDQAQLRAYPVWFAAYTDLPFGASNFAVWQYSETGHVDGIDHVVDYDIIIDL